MLEIFKLKLLVEENREVDFIFKFKEIQFDKFFDESLNFLKTRIENNGLGLNRVSYSQLL